MATSASAMTPAVPEDTPGPIYVDTQHEDLVHDAQLDYYGCKLATSSSGELHSCRAERACDFHLTFSFCRSHCQNLQCL